MRALGDVIARFPNLFVLSDEIYEHINYTPEPFTSFLTACPDLRERLVVVNGVSKAYAMTGWRIGYAAGPAPLVAIMGKIQSQSTSNPSSISQAAAVAALTGPQDFVQTALAEYQARCALVFRALSAIDGLRLRAPEGAFYAFPDCSGLIGAKAPDGTTIADGGQLAAYLLKEARVAVVPGSAFGLDPCFRISFATSRSNLEAALDQLTAAVMRLRR